MKSGKLTLLVALAAVLFSSCTNKEVYSYTCRCTGNAMGPVETYTINTHTDKKAREQCESYSQPPAADSTVCILDMDMQ